MTVRRGLMEAGLSGIGGDDGLYWGVRRPDHLAPAAVLHYALHAGHPPYRPRPVTAARNNKTTTTPDAHSAAFTGVDSGAAGVSLR